MKSFLLGLLIVAVPYAAEQKVSPCAFKPSGPIPQPENDFERNKITKSIV